MPTNNLSLLRKGRPFIMRGASIMSSALSRDTTTSARWERAQGRRRRSSQTLDAAPSTPHDGNVTKHGCFFQHFVLRGFFWPVPTKAHTSRRFSSRCMRPLGGRCEVAPIGSLIDAPEASSANRPGGFSLLEVMLVVVSSKLSALSRQLSASLLIYGQPYPRFPLDKRLEVW